MGGESTKHSSSRLHSSMQNNQIAKDAYDKFVSENPVVQGMDENARIGFYLESQQHEAKKQKKYGKGKES